MTSQKHGLTALQEKFLFGYRVSGTVVDAADSTVLYRLTLSISQRPALPQQTEIGRPLQESSAHFSPPNSSRGTLMAKETRFF